MTEEDSNSEAPDTAGQQARCAALELLRNNSTQHGFVASADRQGENYYAVWGRDGAICALAALRCDDAGIQEAGKRTLFTLAEHQADNGQIPSYLLLNDAKEISQVVYGGLGAVTSIDSNLWFLIAAQSAVQDAGRSEFTDDWLLDVYARTLSHLKSIDSDNCGLLEIPVAGDWSDVLDRSYHILYDEVLWYHALICAASLYSCVGNDRQAAGLRDDASLVRQRLNDEFWWNPQAIQRCRERYFLANDIPANRTFPFYQSHLKPFYNHWYERFDAFGNVLACLMDVASSDRQKEIVQQVLERGLDSPYPIRVLDPPVQQDDEDWDMVYQEKERPYSYHNGGIWPLAGAFWTVLLASTGRHAAAQDALLNVIESQQVGSDGASSWTFPEYLDGETGEPIGRRWQSWNAASLLLAEEAVRTGSVGCFEKRM